MRRTPYLSLPIYEDNEQADFRTLYKELATIIDRKAHETDTRLQSIENRL